MDLTSETKTIEEIFPTRSDIEYIVPIYQRNYSWKSSNVETLFYDIVKENSGYYVGNLLVTPTRDEYDSNKIKKNSYDIVDGQQRLTTISLILAGIFYHLKYAENLKKFIISESSIDISYSEATSDIRRQLDNQYTKRPRLRLLDKDKENYNEILKILTIKNLKNYKPPKNIIIGKRFKEIVELLKLEFFKNGDEDYKEKNVKELLDFYNKVNSMEILRIKVSNISDAFTIFTSFNAKGLPLTLIDLLKSYYLKQSVNVLGEQRSLNKWYELLDKFSDENGEPQSKLVTQFLQNNFDTFEPENKKTTRSITKNEALNLYDKLFEENGAEYIDILISRAEIFSSFTNNAGAEDSNLLYSDAMISSLEKISNLDTTSIYPILLFTLNEFKNENIDQIEMEEILDYLNNYYVRRNITLRPKSSNLRAKALNSVRKMQFYKDESKTYLEIIKSALNEIADVDEDFKQALKNNIYEINSDTTRIILVDLEKEHGTYFNKQRPENLNERNQKNKQYRWTLEHIMPQKPSNESEWNNITEDELAENVHKLGNLTLTGYNSELSNGSFKNKRDYKDKITNSYEGLRTPLFLNESIVNKDLGEKISDKETWTIDDINRRNDELIKYVLELYPLD